ncbi:chlorophyll synthesis pathway protein BchC [Brevundimonas variabilis]|uniref:3-hydroxyethyl bacteriochlorophyllide a dehydrogenase n=1 Tax=Brevundimonas variabilis TaxID=74312 RepID=A0A7W9CIH5_9CAUL|nr:chlorophyll synthesis pathway protein BchC [Brevundimonas variabilis]MBB5745998.1 3-hydroxyethyl bacteriochlorophyllide a dehydrogenase [Brevundimonas variabilis]
MHTLAVVLEEPRRLAVRPLDLKPAGPEDVVVTVDWSGISTGTERLLWDGRMPHFPGLGYPLVPGYEAVGTVVDAGAMAQSRIGDRVFVPGSSSFIDARGLFGGAARTLIAPQSRTVTLPQGVDDQGVLLSLAATAYHAIVGGTAPDLIVGHGVLGRLILRITEAMGAERPTVWETNPTRRHGVAIHPDADDRRDYRSIYDASGAEDLMDFLVARLGRSGEIVLAGFYEARLSFAFPMAFMKEARFRIAAEFRPEDVTAVTALIADGRLSLDGLITHRRPAVEANDAYPVAFGDADCLKMILDWRNCA